MLNAINPDANRIAPTTANSGLEDMLKSIASNPAIRMNKPPSIVMILRKMTSLVSIRSYLETPKLIDYFG